MPTQLTTDTVETVHKLKKMGYAPSNIAKRLKLAPEVVHEALGIIKSMPMQVGYFNSLIERKTESNSLLRDQQDMLLSNVGALWKLLKMLESKKRMLEKHIEELESYVHKGSQVCDIFIKKGVEIDDPVE